MTTARGPWGRLLDPGGRVLWPLLAGLMALMVFLSTMQVDVNGSVHAYATDVGEIQNALPRWGTIHHSGYPLYTAAASAFVTALRWLGVEPAASASLFSALWGALAAALVVVLAQELGVPGPLAVGGALAFALATSVWVFASLAEVHTLTLVWSLSILLFALRFGRRGQVHDLYLLAFCGSQGIVHQRSVLLLGPAVLALIWPRLSVLWRHLVPVVGIGLLAPLTYLYLPWRAWMGATWLYGSPGTWQGLKDVVFFNLPGYTVDLRAGPGELWQRIRVALGILAEDMWWPLLILGLAGLGLPAGSRRSQAQSWRESLGLTLAWLPSLVLAVMIWRGRVIDAQLAAKLPIMAMAGTGLGLLLGGLEKRFRRAGAVAALALVLILAVWGWQVRPFVLSVTRDPSAEAVIATAARVAPPPDARPMTLVSTWGMDYWALAYAQAWRDELPGLNLVDHNADLRAIVERGDRLLIPAKILYVFPLPRWEERLGRLYLSSAAPGVVEMHPSPPVAEADVPPMDAGARSELAFDGIRARAATLEPSSSDEWLLTVYWQADEAPGHDYSVAVHLLAHDPPQGPADVLAQADSLHPVDGWYPTSRWSPGEIVCDRYAVPVPPGSEPVGVRVALYRSDPQGGFLNSPWLFLPAPER